MLRQWAAVALDLTPRPPLPQERGSQSMMMYMMLDWKDGVKWTRPC